MSFLKNFDVYPKTFDEFKERTVSGAAISVCSIIVILFLLVAEVNWYFQVDRINELHVDTNVTGKMAIFLNITFPRVHCDILSLDAMDGFGEMHANIQHDVAKVRLDLTGSPIEKKQTGLGEHPEEVKENQAALANAMKKDYCGDCYGSEEKPGDCCNTCEDVREAYRKKGWALLAAQKVEQCVREKLQRQLKASAAEGCNIHGHLEVHKVQGNFHFAPGKSFTHNGNLVHDYLPFEVDGFNVTHKIHKLGFGIDYPGLVNPLDDQARLVTEGSGLFQYFVKVVPTVYEPLTGPAVVTNQYSVTEHFKVRDHSFSGLSTIPGVFFMYDLSPIMVHIRETQRHMSRVHFITYLCSLIGGVFTVAGIVDRVWYSMSKVIISKLQ